MRPVARRGDIAQILARAAAQRTQRLGHGCAAAAAGVDAAAEVCTRRLRVFCDAVIVRVPRIERCAVAQIQVYVRRDAGDAGAVAALPCAVAAAVAGLRIPDGEPAIPLLIGRVVEHGCPPVTIGVNADAVACCAQRVAEDGRMAQDLGLRAAGAHALILQQSRNLLLCRKPFLSAFSW